MHSDPFETLRINKTRYLRGIGSLTTSKSSICWYVNKTDLFGTTQRFCKWHLNETEAFETSQKYTTWRLNKTDEPETL